MLLIAMILLANLIIRGPDIHLAFTTPPSQWFTGQASWFDPWDINVYITAINWGHQGHLLLSNRYDATDTAMVLLYPLYTLSGLLTSFLPISPSLTFHVLGSLVSILLITYIWRFTAQCFKKTPERIMALALSVFGGGIGWLIFPKTTSADLSHANFTLQAALRTPHEGISLLLLLLAINSYRASRLFRFTLTVIGLTLLHPYMLLPLGIIIALHSYPKLQWHFLFPLGLIGSLYYLLLGRPLSQNPSFHDLIYQTHIPLTLTESLFGFGLLVIPLTVALRHPQKTPTYKLLVIWFISQLILVFIPLPINRLLVRGLWIPATFLSTYGLLRLSKKALIRSGFVALCCLSTLFIAYRRDTYLAESPWVRLPYAEAVILQQVPCTKNSVILASHPIANLIPTISLCRTYAGHQVQTPQFHPKFTQVGLFFTGKYSRAQAQEFLNNSHANYIFWGQQEQRLANRTDFPYPDLVTIRAAQAGVILYEYPIQ